MYMKIAAVACIVVCSLIGLYMSEVGFFSMFLIAFIVFSAMLVAMGFDHAMISYSKTHVSPDRRASRLPDLNLNKDQ